MARTTKLNRVFNRIELNYTNITNQIKSWLGTIYDKSSILFNASSPYGQILEVTKEFFLQNILYLKNAVRQLDIEQANSKRMISNIARISGHNPSRAIAAKGTLKFKLKQGVPIDKYVSNGQIIIYDNTLIKNRTNGLFYSLKIGNFRNYFSLLPGCQFFINVVQGRYETQTFTGDGTIIQSFQVTVSNNSAIDNFDFKVTLNGINLQIKDHIYDMLENEYACYTRTGFNGGLDIYFGNGVNGIVPPIGSVIEVTYLLNNGIIGNILNNKLNDFIFIDDIYDDSGNAILVNQLFDIFIETDIKFASNGESVEYTKSVVPYVSRNFVLATPSQYIYHLKKLNIFSKVNAFNTLDMVNIDIDSDRSLDQININEMYLYLIPRITDYFSTDVNYFNVPLEAFYLDETEKKRIIDFLKIQGIISITSYIKILVPVKKFFIVNVFIRRFEDVLEDNIRENVISKLSDFFATYSRYDRIVKSDIIAILKTIDGIDSVNIEFVGKANEDYHRDGALLSSNKKSVLNSTYVTNTNSVNVSADNYRNIVVNTNQNNSYYQYDLTKDGTNSTNAQLLANAITVNGQPVLDQKGINNTSVGDSTIVAYTDLSEYDPKKMVGIDPILGDIIIGYNELVILRGGWKNRNDIYFSEDPNTAIGFSSVNIIWKGVTER